MPKLQKKLYIFLTYPYVTMETVYLRDFPPAPPVTMELNQIWSVMLMPAVKNVTLKIFSNSILLELVSTEETVPVKTADSVLTRLMRSSCLAEDGTV